MNKISIVAHRGGGALNTENSLQAFSHAIALGADEVECDVHMMSDGKIVVFHDFDLQQLTGETGKIAKIDERQRQNLRLNGCDEPPPLLEELAALLTPTCTRLHIEIKTQGNLAHELAIATKSVEILRQAKLLDRVCAISFEPACLLPFIEAGCPSGPCIDAPDKIAVEDWPQQFKQWQQAGYHDLSLNGGHATPEFVQAAREAGFSVGVWTINGPARLTHWLHQAVDYITTDQPDLALNLRAKAK